MEDLEGVAHIDELSNHPVEQLALNITYEIKHKGSVHLTKLAPRQGKAVRLHVVLQRFGVLGRDFVDEESPVNCRTNYVV